MVISINRREKPPHGLGWHAGNHVGRVFKPRRGHQARCPADFSELKQIGGAALLLAAFLVFPIAAWVDNDTQPIEDASSDLTQAGVWKRADESLVFEIRTRGWVAPNHIRILLFDREPGDESPRNQAAWMVERGRLYARASDVPGWAWNEVGPVISVAASNVWIVHVPAGIMPERGGWLVESTRADGQTVDCVPNTGIFRFAGSEVPVWSAPARRMDGALQGLYERAPVALSLRYETELKAIRWKELSEIPPLIWMPTATCAVPIRVHLRDAASGEIVQCVFTSAWAGAEWTRWDGEALGIFCSARMGTNATGGQFELFLKSDEERRIEALVTFVFDGQGWTWYGERAMRPLAEERASTDVAAQESGAAEIQFYPLGIIARDHRMAWIACHPDEPRSMQVRAEYRDSETRVAANCSLALTSATSNLARRASLSLLFGALESSASNIFLAAVAALHDQGILGGARPLALRGDIAAWPKVGGYYVLPLISGVLRSPKDAELALDLCAGLPDPAGAEAMVTQLGGMRDQDAAYVLRSPAPDRAGPRIDWWLDPDIRTTRTLPISPAMYVWQSVEAGLGDRRAEGVALRLPDMATRQYDTAALGMADHPCNYDLESGRLFLPGRGGVFEFLQMAHPKIRAANKKLALEVDGALDAFSLRFADAFVLTTSPDRPEEDAVDWLDRLRLIAGARAIFAEPSFFDAWSPEHLPQYALRWGLWPVGEPEECLAACGPLLERMARRGWNPSASAMWLLSNVDVRVFGSPAEAHEQVFSRRDNARRVFVHTMNPRPDWLFINPLNADVRPGDWAWRLKLLPGETVVWSVLPASRVSEQEKFIATWSETWPPAKYILLNLESLRRERALGCVAAVDWPHPLGEPGRQRLVLTLKNIGNQPVKFGGIRLLGRFVWAVNDGDILAPGGETNVLCEFDGQGVPTNGWMELQWQVERAGQPAVIGSRRWRATVVDAIEVMQERSELVQRGPDCLVARFDLQNHTDEEQVLTVRWEGDFKGGRSSVTLQPRESRLLEIELQRGKATMGELFVRVDRGEQLVARLHYELAKFPNIGNRRE